MSNWVNVCDIIHPVGTVYWSTQSSAEVISLFFGGTWEKIDSKTLDGGISIYAYLRNN